MLAAGLALSVYALGHHLLRHRLPLRSAPPEGFAGWLLVLAAGQWLAVLLLLGAFARRLPRTLETSSVATQLRLLVDLVLLAFVAWAAIVMSRRSRLYPRLLRVELAALAMLPPLDAVWMAEEGGAYVTEPKLWIAFAVRLAATSMVAAAWYLYSQHSLRMRATFVR
jgi:hypothetical protein